MRIRQLTIERFRGIQHLQIHPGARNVILGPNNASKSTVIEAMDLLLSTGRRWPRPPPSELDYFQRDSTKEFLIEAVIAEIPEDIRVRVVEHLEGWNSQNRELVPEPDGENIEPVVRLRVRGLSDLTFAFEYAKPESAGQYIASAFRSSIGWVSDSRVRDPERQMSFYRGGLLDRLFSQIDLDPPLNDLRGALSESADLVNEHDNISQTLANLAEDLHRLGLITEDDRPMFEIGAVSKRELLQTLRLSLPAGDARIPLAMQGRGIQRLIMVSTLLRIALDTTLTPICGFEEPEEALEPLRQNQLAKLLRNIADTGGQIFIVTHSPEIVRTFEVDDFLLFKEKGGGEETIVLADNLTPATRQTYERKLDGAVVRGLFTRVPFLVEGPSDRAVFDVFWQALVEDEVVPAPPKVGLDVINAEGVPFFPMLASVLDAAGKSVAVWAEQDNDRVRETIQRLRNENHCACLLVYRQDEHFQNLEYALSQFANIQALLDGLSEIARDRDWPWAEQRADLLSRCDALDGATRDACKSTDSIQAFFELFDEPSARVLIASALSSRNVSPFEMKGSRPARLLAQKIVLYQGVPPGFRESFEALGQWIVSGGPQGLEITM